jgi:hypothetical protein
MNQEIRDKHGSSQRLEDPEQVEAIAEKISSGKAVLRVIAYPWGVELDVADRGDAHE